MKKTIITVMAFLLVALPGNLVLAMDDSHKGHDHGSMDHSGHMGKLIREAKVDGYGLTYHLIDMQAKMKGMKGMEACGLEARRLRLSILSRVMRTTPATAPALPLGPRAAPSP